MNIPWYAFMWIPGTLLGCAIGILGAFIGVQASRGKLRRATMNWMLGLMFVSGAFLIVGVVLLLAGQPWGIWYGLLLPGFLGFLLLGILLPVVRKRLREQSPLGS